MSINNATNREHYFNIVTNPPLTSSLKNNTVYVIITSGTYNLTLPVESPAGSEIIIIQINSLSIINVKQNANQVMRTYSNLSTTVGATGKISQAAPAACTQIDLICITEDLEFMIYAPGLNPLSLTFT